MYDVTLLTEDLEKCGRCPACCRGETAFIERVSALEDGVVRLVPEFVGPSITWVPEMVFKDCQYFRTHYHHTINV